jgi:tetratricopeptide (TPR) repeat protein
MIHTARAEIVMGTRLLLPLIAVVLTVAAVPSARAEDEAAGRRHWDKGQELYKLGRYLEAAREFETGYQVAPRSNFLMNIGHSYRRAQELRKAKTAYESFLRIDPTSPHRAMVEDLIRTIDDALSAQIDPGPPASPPAPQPLPATGVPPAAPAPADVLPPPNAIQVGEPGPPPESQSTSIWRSPWLWAAVGTVLVAGVVGTVYGLTRGSACGADRCLVER